MSNSRSALAFVVLLASVCMATTTAQAQTTWYVDDDAPGDPGPGDPTVSDPDEDGSAEHPFDAIQQGIDAAVNGDVVLVLDGTYTGDGNRDISYGGKVITLRSESSPQNCIIDCEGTEDDHHRAFGFFGGETDEAVVKGFTITNGVVGSGGGAIRCEGGTGPTILNCIITGNAADHRGGGVYCDNESNPVLINCTIRGNSVEYRGAGISCDHGSSPTMLNCAITGNVADCRGGGVYCDHESNPMLINCIVSGNTAAMRGSGISCDHASNATIINSTVSANTGGGDGIFLDHDSSPTITSSIVWGNTSLEIGVWSGDPVVTFSDIRGGWPGEGNIDADPLFVDPDNGDLHLLPGSPVIDAGDNTAVPAGVLADLDGRSRFWDDPDTPDTGNGTPPIVDVGAYEFGSMTCADEDGDGKVTLCHCPSGDPDKARTITVGVAASAAHLAHGDLCGPCP